MNSTVKTPELTPESAGDAGTDVTTMRAARSWKSLTVVLSVLVVALIAAQAWSMVRLLDLERQVETQSADLRIIESELNSAQSDVRSIQGDLNSLNNDLVTIASGVSDIGDGVSALSTDYYNLAGDLNSMNGRVNRLGNTLDYVSALARNADRYAHCHGYDC